MNTRRFGHQHRTQPLRIPEPRIPDPGSLIPDPRSLILISVQAPQLAVIRRWIEEGAANN